MTAKGSEWQRISKQSLMPGGWRAPRNHENARSALEGGAYIGVHVCASIGLLGAEGAYIPTRIVGTYAPPANQSAVVI